MRFFSLVTIALLSLFTLADFADAQCAGRARRMRARGCSGSSACSGAVRQPAPRMRSCPGGCAVVSQTMEQQFAARTATQRPVAASYQAETPAFERTVANPTGRR